jgi:hypothetical protein
VWLNRGACQEVTSEIPVVQGGSASVWSSGETLEEGAASRYAVLPVYSLQGIPGSGQRIDNTHLFGLVLLARNVFPFGLKISAWGTALRCWDVSICVFAMLTKWFSMTRLETRTKESNIYASIWVENPDAQ